MAVICFLKDYLNCFPIHSWYSFHNVLGLYNLGLPLTCVDLFVVYTAMVCLQKQTLLESRSLRLCIVTPNH